MNKFIAALLIAGCSTAAPAKDFMVMDAPAGTVDMLASMPTEELCEVASSAYLMCDSSVYNVANFIIILRDVADTRACERGLDVGYTNGLALLDSLPESEQEAIKACNYIFEGEDK